MTILFPRTLTLTFEQKTDSGYTEDRTFAAGTRLEVDHVASDPGSEFSDIYLAPETGWVATGVHKSAFEVVV